MNRRNPDQILLGTRSYTHSPTQDALLICFFLGGGYLIVNGSGIEAICVLEWEGSWESNFRGMYDSI